MLLERMGETVTLETADGHMVDVGNVLFHDADASDQTVMDVQTRFINQARYKGDQKTITILWPASAPHELMDAHIWVRGGRYRVYANPSPPSHSPVGYDLVVTATMSLFLHDVELLRAERTRDQWGVWHEVYESTPARANLLRLSDDVSHDARRDAMERITLIELPPDTWDASYVAFRMGGRHHAITSVDYAGEVVVVGGTEVVGEVAEGG